MPVLQVHIDIEAWTECWARIEGKLDQVLLNQAQEQKTMAKLDDAITALTAQVATDTTVIASAVTLINGIAAQIAAAVAAATAAGATPAQLAAITALGTSLATSDAALAAAVAANTPAGTGGGPTPKSPTP